MYKMWKLGQTFFDKSKRNILMNPLQEVLKHDLSNHFSQKKLE